jgi:hypothetical protein
MASKLYLIVGVLTLVVSSATRADEPAPPAAVGRAWATRCDDVNCSLSMSVPVREGRTDDAVVLEVSLKSGERAARFISVLLPTDVVRDADVVIRFVDTKPDGTTFKLVPGSETYALPIIECSASQCTVRVDPQLDNGDGTSLDLFDALQKHDFLWVLFKSTRRDEPYRALVPVNRFKDAVDGVMAKKVAP